MNTEHRLFGVFALAFLFLGVTAVVAVNEAIHGKGNEMIAEVRAINEKMEAPTPLPPPTPVNLDAVWRSIEDLAAWKSNYEDLSQRLQLSEQEVKRLEERTWVLEAFLLAPYQMPPVDAKYLGPGEKLYPWTEYSGIVLGLFWSPDVPVFVEVRWSDAPLSVSGSYGGAMAGEIYARHVWYKEAEWPTIYSDACQMAVWIRAGALGDAEVDVFLLDQEGKWGPAPEYCDPYP